MARRIHSRLKITGTLVAQSPLHIGGIGGNADTDLALAINGRGEYYIPGTSLAGALRGWMAEIEERETESQKGVINDLWGFQRENDRAESEGHASFILVEDAAIALKSGVITEIRDGVGINRNWGTAADGQKYERAIVPTGSKIAIDITVERNAEQQISTYAKLIVYSIFPFFLLLSLLPILTIKLILQYYLKENEWNYQQSLFASLLQNLQAGELHLGAAKTRGLGRVKLNNATIHEQKLLDRQGMLKTLKNDGNLIDLENFCARNHSIPQPSQLTFDIYWHPLDPVMVKAESEGIAVNILPLVSAVENSLTLVIPGSSIKGVMRSQAERIVRTVRSRSSPDDFLEQVQVELVKTLFGTAAKIDKNKRQLGYLGALGIDDCYANIPISLPQWTAIQSAKNSEELQQALAQANLSKVQSAFHVAVDRWTGGAADGYLYNALEPIGITWQPIYLTLNLARLGKKNSQADEFNSEYLPRVALLLLVLRDLMDGRLTIGFGGNRGMGAIAVEKIDIKGKGELGELAALDNVTLTKSDFSEINSNLLNTLNQSWITWIESETNGNNEQ